MNHTFVPDRSKVKCAKCSYGFLAHTAAATCESCGKVGKCDILDKMLLCEDDCYLRQKGAMEASVNSAENVIETVMDLARRADLTIRYNGDAFNAKTLANADVKKEIWADESLTEEQKHYKFHNFLADRIGHFRKVMFDADSTKYDAQIEVNAALNMLRDFAGTMAKDIQQKLKESDKNYAPAITAVKIKAAGVRKNVKTAEERLIEAYAALNECSIESATAIIKGRKAAQAS